MTREKSSSGYGRLHLGSIEDFAFFRKPEHRELLLSGLRLAIGEAVEHDVGHRLRTALGTPSPSVKAPPAKDRLPPKNEPALAGGSACHGPCVFDGVASGKA